MPELFAEIEPWASGRLDTSDGQSVYWERCGNPDGRTVVYLHGGPGSGCSPNTRRMFDPDVFDVVLFDQRGCGRSRPLANEPGTDLSHNTTHHLLEDLEHIRAHLQIERWMVVGVSWGTTLALAYAERHQDRVTAVLAGLVTNTTRREVDWITHEVGRIFPREWDRFASAVPTHLRDVRLVDAYATLLMDPDPAVHEPAAEAWCRWRTHTSHSIRTTVRAPATRIRTSRLRFARLVTHYWRHAAFLEDDQLLREVQRLEGIPGVLIHGRFDVSSPLDGLAAVARVARRSRTS